MQHHQSSGWDKFIGKIHDHPAARVAAARPIIFTSPCQQGADLG